MQQVLNKVVLIGRLVRDPELRYTQSGIACTSFTIAVDRSFKDAQGNKQTDFIKIICWRKLAEIVANALAKGRLVAIAGALQIRSYEAQDGSRRQAAEVVADDVRFLDKPKEGTKGDASEQSSYGEEYSGNEEDLPF